MNVINQEEISQVNGGCGLAAIATCVLFAGVIGVVVVMAIIDKANE